MALFQTLNYTLIKKDKPFQIRQYDDYLLASALSEITQTQDSGFNQVFRYISGHNSAKTKFSMTTPVVTYEEKNLLVTGFYLPTHHTKESLPAPLDKDVFINEIVGSLYAVIRFSGRWGAKNFDEKDALLLAYINKEGYAVDSPRLIFRYNPPFVPPCFRRNEIAYKIRVLKD